MHRLISSDMATVAGSRRAALGMTTSFTSSVNSPLSSVSALLGAIPINRRPQASFPPGIDWKHPAFPLFSPDKEEAVMSTFREKAQGRTKQMVGQMIGDEQLVEEGQKQERKAEQQARPSQAKPSQTKTSAESSQAKSSQAKSSQAKSSDDPSGQASRR